MPVMGVIIPDLCTKFEVSRSFLREIWSIFRLSIQRPRPFELQMGSRAARVMGFLPADFQLAMTFYSRVQARDKGQTERRTETTAINASCLHPTKAGRNNPKVCIISPCLKSDRSDMDTALQGSF